MTSKHRKKSPLLERIVPIKGMHCHSCEILVSENLKELPGVTRAKVSVTSKSAIITATRLPSDAMIKEAVEAAGYAVGYENQSFWAKDKRVYRDVLIGLAITALLIVIARATGWADVSKLTTQSSSVTVTALIVGLTAGISTCMALVGGLVLGISAKHAERYPSATPLQRFRPHIFFNFGRIIGFTVLGLFIGAIGGFFQLSGTMLGWLMIAVSVVMIFLGLSLTGLFPRLKSLSLPSSVAKYFGIEEQRKKEYSWHGAFLAGVATFFLPCGFTQAMQLVAMSSGSPFTGAAVMGMFAIGTTPGLLGVGGLTSAVKGTFAQTFFRIVGVAVVALALINFSNGVTLANLRLPDFQSPAPAAIVSSETKQLTTTFRVQPDIQPSTFTTKVGQKTALVVNVKEEGQGCMSTIMIPGLFDRPLLLQEGKQLVLEFTPKKSGIYQITCAMGIPRGTIKVEG